MRIDGGRMLERNAGVAHSNARTAWALREGVVLELRAGGTAGVGEASPLAGYSADDHATCRRELDRCWELLATFELNPDNPVLDTLLDTLVDTLRAATVAAGVRTPAAVFALVTALLDLASRVRSGPAWAALRGDACAEPIPLSALAEGASAEGLAGAAARACTRGIGVVKVMVGGEAGSRETSHGSQRFVRASATRSCCVSMPTRPCPRTSAPHRSPLSPPSTHRPSKSPRFRSILRLYEAVRFPSRSMSR